MLTFIRIYDIREDEIKEMCLVLKAEDKLQNSYFLQKAVAAPPTVERFFLLGEICYCV